MSAEDLLAAGLGGFKPRVVEPERPGLVYRATDGVDYRLDHGTCSPTGDDRLDEILVALLRVAIRRMGALRLTGP